MSSTCKPAMSTSITLNQTTPTRFFASFRMLYSLQNTLTSKLWPKNFWSLTVARNCKAVAAKKGYHRFFHLNNISRAFSPRSHWHCAKSITCDFSRACVDIFLRWIRGVGRCAFWSPEPLGIICNRPVAKKRRALWTRMVRVVQC